MSVRCSFSLYFQPRIPFPIHIGTYIPTNIICVCALKIETGFFKTVYGQSIAKVSRSRRETTIKVLTPSALCRITRMCVRLSANPFRDEVFFFLLTYSTLPRSPPLQTYSPQLQKTHYRLTFFGWRANRKSLAEI